MRAKYFNQVKKGDEVLLEIGGKITKQTIEEIIKEDHFVICESGLDVHPNEDGQYIVWEEEYRG